MADAVPIPPLWPQTLDPTDEELYLDGRFDELIERWLWTALCLTKPLVGPDPGANSTLASALLMLTGRAFEHADPQVTWREQLCREVANMLTSDVSDAIERWSTDPILRDCLLDAILSPRDRVIAWTYRYDGCEERHDQGAFSDQDLALIFSTTAGAIRVAARSVKAKLGSLYEERSRRE